VETTRFERRQNGTGMALTPEDDDESSYHKAALPEDQLTTDRQRERRARILDAAVEVARTGGFTRVRMREVAVNAGVALGTLYHYFPSKVHLLVMALERELIRFDDLLTENLSDVADPFARLRASVWSLINGMEESDRVTDVLTHAYVASHVVASVEAGIVRRQTAAMFVHLMSQGDSRDVRRHIAVAEVVTDVWTSEVLALVQGRRTYAEMRRRLSTTIDLLAG
jgi:AcrR family transcriptional regulator